MKTRFTILCRFCLLTLFALYFTDGKSQTLPGSYTTSWAGNTFAPTAANPNNFMQNWANSMFVETDGTIYANAFWDEGAKELGIYKNGQCTGVIPNQHGSADGGAITANGTYVWATIDEYKVRRFLKTNLGSQTQDIIVSTATNPVRGLAASATELFASDFSGNSIKVFDTSTGAAVRNWAVTNPGPLALDAGGNVWVLSYTTNSWGPGNTIRCYSTTGTLLKTITLASGVQGKSIAINKTNNELYVTDIGPNMQIHIYGSINGTPSLIQSFGTQGGILAGTKGLVANLKFNVPNLVGIDGAGNLIIWSNGNNTDGQKPVDGNGHGTEFASYTKAGVKNWEVLGLNFVDMGSFDPASDGLDLYTKDEHFTMDYSKPDGQQWTYKGFMMNRDAYPNEERMTNNFTSHDASTVIARRVQGNLFLYMTSMYAKGFSIYRFDQANQGEIAIPAGQLSQWENLWIDNNGNGNVDLGEKDAVLNLPKSEFFAQCVDKNGTIWMADYSSGIRNYPVQSINSFGVPVYSNTSAQVVANPAPFTDIRRMDYDAETDVMYLTGYTAQKKNTTNNWGIAGRVLSKYSNWSTGNRTASYSIDLPYNTTTNESAVSFTVEGNYIFVVGVTSRGKVWVYNTSNGTLAGTMIPGDNVGGVTKTGWCDLRYSVDAFKRSNGEYLVTVEEDGFAKVLIYRWNTGVANVAVTGALVSPTTVSVAVGATATLTKTIAPSNATNQNVTWSSSNTAVATVNTSGLVTGVSAGAATITLTTVDGAKTATSAITVTTTTGTWTTVENTDASWTWSGFTLDPCATCSGGSSHSTNVANSFGQYTFTGTSVELYCENWVGSGGMQVFIDGVSKGTFPQSGLSKFATISGLTNASHLLKVVASDTNWPSLDYISFTGASAATSPNLGFENDFDSWATYGTASITTTAANVRSGAKAGFFSNGGGNYTFTGLTPGATYSLRGWIKAVSGTEIWIVASNYGGSNIGLSSSSTSWTQTGNIIFTMGATNTTANIATWTGTNSSAYFDDFTVTPSVVGTGNSGNVTQDTWTNITGTTVASIPVSTAPNSTSILTSLETPSNIADNYGVRIRGYIVPTATGNYTFYVAGDDNAEFYLSSDNLPINSARIAYHTDWTNPREWTKYPTQTSAVKTLSAGQKYYFRALMKEGGGGDNLAVGWSGPGIPTISVIGAANLDKYIPTGAAGEMSAREPGILPVKASANAFSVYPNPATSFVTVDFNGGQNGEPARVEVIDLQGRKIYSSGATRAPKLQLSTSQYGKGIYIIRINKGTESVTKKLIIE